jgi:hypothetical protein
MTNEMAYNDPSLRVGTSANQGQEGAGEMVANLAEAGAYMLPGIGNVAQTIAGTGMSMVNAGSEHEKKVYALMKGVAVELAYQNNIPLEHVTIQHLLQAAEYNKAIKQGLDAILFEKGLRPVNGFTSTVAAIAASSVLSGGLLAIPAGMAAAMGTGMATDEIVKQAQKFNPEHTALAQVQQINQSLEAGEPVDVADVFATKVSLDDTLRHGIIARFGQDFFEMDVDAKRMVMNDPAYVQDLTPHCRNEAALIQEQGMRAEGLMFGGVAHRELVPSGGFASRELASRTQAANQNLNVANDNRQNSFAERVSQQQASTEPQVG